MTFESVKDQLSEIILPYIPEGKLPDSLDSDSDLMEDLNINSAHIVDIILDIEDKFDIEITDEEAESMLTVGAAVQLIQSKQ
jgi:acyl carrier protein